MSSPKIKRIWTESNEEERNIRAENPEIRINIAGLSLAFIQMSGGMDILISSPNVFSLFTIDQLDYFSLGAVDRPSRNRQIGRRYEVGKGKEERRHVMGHTGDMSVCRLSEVILLGMSIARKQVRSPVISVVR